MDLLCSETDGIPRAFEDKVMLEDERVISNLLILEERFLPSGGYFSLQPEVKPYMRREVAQWMREVCEIGLHIETDFGALLFGCCVTVWA